MTAPPVTLSPACLATGRLSPVISDSSTWLSPSTISPSTGTRSPGRTTTRSPTRMASIGTSLSIAVAPHPRGRRAQRLQRADRLGGLALGARLQPLAEQHQRDDDRRGLEVQMHAVGTGRAAGTRSGHRPRWCPAPPAGPCCRCRRAAPSSRRDRSARRARTAPAWPAPAAASPAASSARRTGCRAWARPAAATAGSPAPPATNSAAFVSGRQGVRSQLEAVARHSRRARLRQSGWLAATPCATLIVACSVARLTLASSTPATLPSAFSTRAEQLAQVMPVMSKVKDSVGMLKPAFSMAR